MTPIQACPFRKALKVNVFFISAHFHNWLDKSVIVRFTSCIPFMDSKEQIVPNLASESNWEKDKSMFFFFYLPHPLSLPLSFRNHNHLSHFSPLSGVSCCQASSRPWNVIQGNNTITNNNNNISGTACPVNHCIHITLRQTATDTEKDRHSYFVSPVQVCVIGWGYS